MINFIVKNVESGSKGGSDVVQSKFNKLLNSDYYKNNPGYDCSEIATDFYDTAGQQGKIYRIEGKDGVINGYEYGKVYDFEYHEVYSDGVYIYDPRYKNTPVLKDDYFRAMEENKEKCIGKLIHSRIPIEWMRYNMYIEDDRYRNIPMLVFRVQDSCPENIIDSLKKCVDAFKGNLNWKMFKDPLSRKGNYLITISELEVLHRECCAGRVQYNQIDFWGAEKYKKYCDDAIQDIPMLEKHIEETL